MVDTDRLRRVLLSHHPIAHTDTGPLKGCRCGQVRPGEDVIAHVITRVIESLTSEFTPEQWETEKADPEAGHTFRLQAVSRGSYAVLDETTGEPGPHTDAVWFEAERPFVIEVRGWSLQEAVRKAAQLPLPLWSLDGRRLDR